MDVTDLSSDDVTTSQFAVTEVGATDGSPRFELRRDGELVSYAPYRLQGAAAVVPHVETLSQYRGNGFADRLMGGMIEILRETGRTIVPICSFAATYLRDHPEHADLVHPGG